MTKPGERFFQNRDCPYFPCHGGVPEEAFSCLFCYCPLYALGRRCGGACEYLPNGTKDCSKCAFPHRAENYDAVLAKWREIAEVVRREDARQD
ncbi:MAG: cysteine-rich small domain-containing protein [Clostridia bacterium]|nr:cysteine-rich small domain-containing protein [Clostridia bacterium]